MTAIRLFDIVTTAPPPQPSPDPYILRAYCTTCRDFTITPENNTCMGCHKPLDRRYDFVEWEPESE